MCKYILVALSIMFFVTTSAIAKNLNSFDKVTEKKIKNRGVNPRIDSESGLKIALGWEQVKTNCTSCHSANIIISQRGNRQTWLEMIRWMQDKQGLWPLLPKTEKSILDYLVKNYPPVAMSRRANLSVEALPANPWKTGSGLKQKKFKVIVLKKR